MCSRYQMESRSELFYHGVDGKRTTKVILKKEFANKKKSSGGEERSVRQRNKSEAEG